MGWMAIRQHRCRARRNHGRRGATALADAGSGVLSRSGGFARFGLGEESGLAGGEDSFGSAGG